MWGFPVRPEWTLDYTRFSHSRAVFGFVLDYFLGRVPRERHPELLKPDDLMSVMPTPTKEQQRAPAAPYLVAPREEAVMNGAAVPFSWEDIPDATSYLLEVAADPHFEAVVFSQRVTGAPSLTVTDVFAPDRSTYYWRVISCNDAGTSHGDVIESFISGTEDDAARHYPRPDHKERLGPFSELITGGSQDVMYLRSGDPNPRDEPIADEAIPPEAYYVLEDAVGVQHEGVEARQILGFFAVVLAVIALAIAGVFGIARSYTPGLVQQLALQANYPERREADLQATGQLNRFERIDNEQGRYRIPVDHAIDLMVREARETPPAEVSAELPLQ